MICLDLDLDLDLEAETRHRFEMPRRSLAPTSGDVARPAHPAGCAGPGGPRTISESERDLTVASAGADKPKFDVNAVDDAQDVRARWRSWGL